MLLTYTPPPPEGSTTVGGSSLKGILNKIASADPSSRTTTVGLDTAVLCDCILASVCKGGTLGTPMGHRLFLSRSHSLGRHYSILRSLRMVVPLAAIHSHSNTHGKESRPLPQ